MNGWKPVHTAASFGKLASMSPCKGAPQDARCPCGTLGAGERLPEGACTLVLLVAHLTGIMHAPQHCEYFLEGGQIHGNLACLKINAFPPIQFMLSNSLVAVTACFQFKNKNQQFPQVASIRCQHLLPVMPTHLSSDVLTFGSSCMARTDIFSRIFLSHLKVK